VAHPTSLAKKNRGLKVFLINDGYKLQMLNRFGLMKNLWIAKAKAKSQAKMNTKRNNSDIDSQCKHSRRAVNNTVLERLKKVRHFG
jgi:hypothetical protein